MSELRRQRLLQEALGDQPAAMPAAEAILRVVGIVALVAFVVLFAETFA